MKKPLSTILCSLVLICWASGALAATSIDLNYAFTSDNYVTNFSLFGPGGVVQDFGGSKETNWWVPLSGTYNGLSAGTTYTLQWEVVNGYSIDQPLTPSEGGGPMAFLGQFSINGYDYLSSDNSIWSVSAGEPKVVDLVEYGALGETNIWSNNRSNLVNLLSPIDPTAQWIGFGAYPGSTSSMTVSATFTTAPVPIPGAALLLGSAILGLVGIRRRQLV